jgi:hypothetical protein
MEKCGQNRFLHNLPLPFMKRGTNLDFAIEIKKGFI